MNRIKTSDVLDPSVQQPFTARSLDFLQDANKDMIKGSIMNMIGILYDSTKYYIVSGLYSYGTNQISEGYIFFNGELYYCSGKISTAAVTNALVLTIDTTTSAGSPYDPVTFTDTVNRDVHLQRRFIMSDAISGTGTVDFNNCIFIDKPITFVSTLKAYDGPGSEVVGGFSTASFGFTQYKIKGNEVEILITGANFVISAGVRKLTFSCPSILAGVNVAGVAIVGFQQGGSTTGFACIAEMDNSVISLQRIENNTDFPAVASFGEIYLMMRGQIY